MGRTIWVGDVHGCARELKGLLDLVALGPDDQLVFVGDLVARGPDTAGVLALVRQTRALCVRGNHEQRLLTARKAQREGTRPPRLSASHQAVFETLSDEEWDFLEALPLSLEFPDHNVRVVHAGVVPGVPFAEQKPEMLLHIRSLSASGEGSDKPAKESWAARYHGSPHIVFGHNAQAGLQLHPAATGLDTGCVYGGRLSALVLGEGQSPPPPVERAACIFSFTATRRHVDFGPRPD